MPICYLSMYPTTPYQCWSNNFSGEGFSPHKQELLSIAARIGEKLFWHWIMPVGEISPEVTRRTLVIKWQGQLLNKEPYSIFPTTFTVYHPLVVDVPCVCFKIMPPDWVQNKTLCFDAIDGVCNIGQ